jgi:glycosyltransferase involved in cell wall biosynthesis
MSKPWISVILPLKDEEAALPELVPAIFSALASSGRPSELIAIDDGSVDGSLEVLKRLRSRDPRLRIIVFRRNFGKSAALEAGFREARGDLLLTIDADLQDDPKEIPRMLAKLEEGWDLVSGWKKVRRDRLGKRLASRLFNWITGRISGLRLHDFNCGFKLYRREVTDALHVYGDLHRFLPAIAHLKGFRVTELPVEHHARPYGRSKYGARLAGLLDLVTVIFTTRYLKKPLHFFGPPGLLLGLAGALINLWLSVLKVFCGQPLSNRPLLFLGVLLMILGLQLVSLGLIGEMITQSQKEPEYQVRERIG